MNLQTTIVGIIGVIIGSIISVFGNFILLWLNTRNDTKQKIITKELNRLFELEELAGELAERSGSYNLKLHDDKLNENFHQMDMSAGKFRRYSNLKQAIRDLNQSAKILVRCQQSNEKDTEARKELENKYRDFINEYEKRGKALNCNVGERTDKISSWLISDFGYHN